MEQGSGVDAGWRVSTTSFEADLFAATQAADGPYAVGDGGLVVVGHKNGWEPVIKEGTLESDSSLQAADTTAEDGRVWFAGSAGVLGMLDIDTGAAMGYDYAGAAVDTWQALTVTGEDGGERGVLANDEGAVLGFELNSEELSFSEPAKPADGEPIIALATAADGTAYAAVADGSIHAYAGTDWEAVGGIDAGATDIAAADDQLLVAGDDGSLYERVDGNWSPTNVADDALRAVDVAEEEIVVLAGEATFYASEDGEHWERATVDTDNRIEALALGPVDVAVGLGGTVLQRARATSGGTSDEQAESEDEEADSTAALDDAEEAAEEATAAAADAANAADDPSNAEDTEEATDDTESAVEDVEAAIQDATNAVTDSETPMSTTDLLVQELLHRADTDDLLTLLEEAEAGEIDLRERLPELLDEPHADCTCGEDCPGGEDCECGEPEASQYGPDCTCKKSTSGHDCSCGSSAHGGHCTTQCGHEHHDHHRHHNCCGGHHGHGSHHEHHGHHDCCDGHHGHHDHHDHHSHHDCCDGHHGHHDHHGHHGHDCC